MDHLIKYVTKGKSDRMINAWLEHGITECVCNMKLPFFIGQGDFCQGWLLEKVLDLCLKNHCRGPSSVPPCATLKKSQKFSRPQFTLL